MLEEVPKAAFSLLAGSVVLRRLASRYGMRHDGGFARRFVAGETSEEAIRIAQSLENAGLGVTLDYLGERTTSTEAAAAATREYLDVIADVAHTHVDRSLSVKLTQLGIEVDRATSIDNLRRILDAGARAEFFVRVDMEQSAYTARTLDAFETLWNIGYQKTGVAIQACLRRSPQDIERLNSLGVSVRLVKGAYRESRAVAFPDKVDVDKAFVNLMRSLLAHGNRPAIATHDRTMIDATIEFATANGIGKDRYDFEMLYGVRRDLQTELAALGYTVRIYLPFGRQWFPYFMRRLGERPANVGFVVKNLINEARR